MVHRVRGLLLRSCLVVLLLLGWGQAVAQAQDNVDAVDATSVLLSNAITYQGWLQQDGAPVTATCDFEFRLFNAANGGAQVGSTLTRPGQTVTAGYFTVTDLNFGTAFATGMARWLQVGARCPGSGPDFTTLTPRQPLTATPFALYAVNNWALRGNAATSPTNFVGTTDPVTLTLRVSNTVALRLVPNADSPSLIGGIAQNSVTPGVLGATISGGGGPDSGVVQSNRVTDHYGVIGGGVGNQAGDGAGSVADRSFATVGGGRTNSAPGELSTVAGGQANVAANLYASVGGGVENNAFGIAATIAGGQSNSANAENATVGGGIENIAGGPNSVVGGGSSNDASGDRSTIAGGNNNTAESSLATVGGGSDNQAGDTATVSGGSGNQATVLAATIGGGSGNQVTGQYAVIGGGFNNRITLAQYATLGGGVSNEVTGQYATLSGGYDNQATGTNSAVGGGLRNTAGESFTSVGGGADNAATAYGATVAGGSRNQANASFATVAGGVAAQATHYGELAHAAGSFTNNQTGQAQASQYVLRATTTNNVAAELYLDGSSQRLTIAPGRTVIFEVQITGRSTGGESAGYIFRGVIENHLGNTTLAGSLDILREDDAAWSVAITADNASDSLRIIATGSNGDSVRWVATVRTTEVQQD